MTRHLEMRRITAALLAALCWAAPAQQAAAAAPDAERIASALKGRCVTRRGQRMLISPSRATRGQSLRVIVVSERPNPGATLVGKGPAGPLQLAVTRLGGPPYGWLATIEQAEAGAHRFALLDAQGEVLACGRRSVAPRRPQEVPRAEKGVWPIERAWTRAMENLYSAWIEKLFDAPAGTQPSWTPLHLVIRDPARNLLYNHLGSDEDGPAAAKAVVVQPDCADLPYFLRAYFAWKLRLPFAYRHCDRGNSRRASRCEPELRSNLSSAPTGESPAARFSYFLRRNVSYVHSGAGRTAPDDDETDLYPVALSRASLRPGTVYVDPYGHLLVVAKWVEQRADRGGLLYAVDGHPDLSVGRKRFWRGAFLFSDKIQGGAGGFKAFRPLRLKGGQLVALTNEEINKSRDYGDHSAGQYKLGIDGFYEAMDRLITPRPLAPEQAYRERLDALYELILERVGSVQAGEDYMRGVGYKVMTMPRGPKIFETSGPWENFSTPARDIRLLIAFEEVVRFPDKVVAHPERFALAAGQSPAAAREALRKLYAAFTKQKTFAYKRSDNSSWTLTMAELIDRRQGLEVAYNPNDCAELRWAARGKELETCKRHAPPDQRQLMESYRSWFATRERPPLR